MKLEVWVDKWTIEILIGVVVGIGLISYLYKAVE